MKIQIEIEINNSNDAIYVLDKYYEELSRQNFDELINMIDNSIHANWVIDNCYDRLSKKQKEYIEKIDNLEKIVKEKKLDN